MIAPMAASLYCLGWAAAAGRTQSSMLLSFERPAPAGRRAATEGGGLQTRRPAGVIRLSTVLENCTEATSAATDKRRLKTGITMPGALASRKGACDVGLDHRQDSKGTRWMPWHQESKKGVNGCDKPR